MDASISRLSLQASFDASQQFCYIDEEDKNRSFEKLNNSESSGTVDSPMFAALESDPKNNSVSSFESMTRPRATDETWRDLKQTASSRRVAKRYDSASELGLSSSCSGGMSLDFLDETEEEDLALPSDEKSPSAPDIVGHAAAVRKRHLLKVEQALMEDDTATQ